MTSEIREILICHMVSVGEKVIADIWLFDYSYIYIYRCSTIIFWRGGGGAD